MVENLGYESAVLKPKWERFCWEFVLSGADGKSAYKKIYPQAKDRTAQVNSSRLLTNATIIQRIQQVQTELRRRFEVTADGILAFLGQALSYDPPVQPFDVQQPANGAIFERGQVPTLLLGQEPTPIRASHRRRKARHITVLPGACPGSQQPFSGEEGHLGIVGDSNSPSAPGTSSSIPFGP